MLPVWDEHHAVMLSHLWYMVTPSFLYSPVFIGILQGSPNLLVLLDCETWICHSLFLSPLPFKCIISKCSKYSLLHCGTWHNVDPFWSLKLYLGLVLYCGLTYDMVLQFDHSGMCDSRTAVQIIFWNAWLVVCSKHELIFYFKF